MSPCQTLRRLKASISVHLANFKTPDVCCVLSSKLHVKCGFFLGLIHAAGKESRFVKGDIKSRSKRPCVLGLEQPAACLGQVSPSYCVGNLGILMQPNQ